MPIQLACYMDRKQTHKPEREIKREGGRDGECEVRCQQAGSVLVSQRFPFTTVHYLIGITPSRSNQL